MTKGKSKLLARLPSGKKRTHGGYSFLATGKLPEHRRYILQYLTGAREMLIKDLGGTEKELTAAQIIIIDRVISKLGILRCIEEHIRENSVMRGQELAPSLRQSYLAYSNSLRLDLMALGIDRKQVEPVQTLAEIVQEIDREKQEKAEKRSRMLQEGRSQDEEGRESKV